MTKLRLAIVLGFIFVSSYYLWGQTLSPRYSLNRDELLRIQRADVNDFTPFVHTIKYNYGDSILGLFTPPIRNQGIQGSCTAWAFGYGCASIQAYEMYQDSIWAQRSPSFLFNQGATDCHRAVSTTITALLRDSGVCSYYLMPYDENDCTTQPSAVQRADGQLNKSTPSSVFSTSVAEYKQFLQIGYPIGVVTYLGEDLERVCDDATLHGVWDNVSITSTDSVHAMCIVGYDDHQHMFKAMNSWGTNSGDNGFVWISYNLVQSGVFSEAYVFRADCNGFVPQIEGSPYLCDTLYHYVRNVPAGATIQWQLINPTNMYFFYEISGPSDRDSVLVVYHVPIVPPLPDYLGGVPFPQDSAMTLKATISSGGQSYTVEQKLYKQSVGIPAISASDNSSPWPRNQSRTFTVTNCQEVPDSLISWEIKRKGKNNTYITMATARGRSLTYKPTVFGDYRIIAYNNGKDCGTTMATKQYTVAMPHSLYAINNGTMLNIILSIENGESQLVPASLDENSEYTLELWSPVYGLMRTKGVQSATEQMSTAGLPQGVYILLLKENGNVIAETKVIVQ